MKRDDLFPRKYLNCSDLKGQPRVVQIKHAPIETLKNPKGEEQRKVVLYFNGIKKALPLNLTNYDSVAGIVGDDETDKWAGARIELFPGTTMLAARPSIASVSGSHERSCRSPRRPAVPRLTNWRTNSTIPSLGKSDSHVAERFDVGDEKGIACLSLPAARQTPRRGQRRQSRHH
jgi:hypothetical protein